MTPELGLQADFQERVVQARLKGLVQASKKHPTSFQAAAVDSHDLIAGREQHQTSRLVKTMTGQVERAVVACQPRTFQKVQVEIGASDLPSDARRVCLDAAAMRWDDRSSRCRTWNDYHAIVLAFDLRCSQSA